MTAADLLECERSYLRTESFMPFLGTGVDRIKEDVSFVFVLLFLVVPIFGRRWHGISVFSTGSDGFNRTMLDLMWVDLGASPTDIF